MVIRFLERLLFGDRERKLSGVLNCFPENLQKGRKELQRIARQTQIELSIVRENNAGAMQQIHWQAHGTDQNMKIFRKILSVTPSFEDVSFRRHGGGDEELEE